MRHQFLTFKFILIRAPVNDPLIKLTPTIKLIGNATVSPKIRLTFFLIELFCIPIIKTKNKEILKVKMRDNFLKRSKILRTN